MQTKIVYSNKIDDLKNHINAESKILLITDENVYSLYYKKINEIMQSESLNVYYLVLPAGEFEKNKDNLFQIYSHCLYTNLDKDSTIIALGGGVITDIVGFAASTFKRGIKLINIPTTLLGQIDAAIGGKNGINLKDTKNAIGNYYDPELVYISSEFLKTLDKRQIISALGEIIKYGIIDSEDFYQYIINNIDNIINLDESTLNYIIRKCVNIKLQIVEKDKYDSNLRQILNLGHTFAHSLESYFNYEILHGEALYLGIAFECLLAKNYDIYNDIINLIKKIKIQYSGINLDDLTEIEFYMKQDKKNKSNQINFTIPYEINNIKLESISTEIIISNIKILINDIKKGSN